MEEKKRLIYPDVLRIISIFCVIVIHVASKLWKTVPILSAEWIAFTAIDSLCRFAVPVFVMVSGMFMLSPEKDRGLKDLYLKKILRILTCFIFWSAFYVFIENFSEMILHRSVPNIDCTKIIEQFISGKYHLWFLYMIVGLYIVTPLLRKIVLNKKDMLYFLMIWFVFCIIKNCMPFIPKYRDLLSGTFDAFKMSIAIEYSGYYVLGYYLHNYTISRKMKTAANILAGLGVVAMTALTAYYSQKKSEYDDTFFEYLLPMTAFLSVSVFLPVQKICEKKKTTEKFRRILGTLSKISFGVYLVHVFILECIFYICVKRLSLPCFVSFGIILSSTLILSTAASYILNKIPIVNKYLV